MAIASIRILETSPPQIEVTNADGAKARGAVTLPMIEDLATDCLVILAKQALKAK